MLESYSPKRQIMIELDTLPECVAFVIGRQYYCLCTPQYREVVESILCQNNVSFALRHYAESDYLITF